MIRAWLVRLLDRLRGRPAASPDRPDTGLWGERVAERLLRTDRRMKILGRRVRVGRRDEIDLIARDGETLVFVEVKTRASENFGRPIESVRRDKRRNLSRAAMRYMLARRERPAHFRFDVVEVVGSPDGPPPTVRHIPNAFPLEGRLRVPW